MYIRVKIGNNEIEFDNKDNKNRELIYRSHLDKTTIQHSNEHFHDICNLISHITKELRENYD